MSQLCLRNSSVLSCVVSPYSNQSLGYGFVHYQTALEVSLHERSRAPGVNEINRSSWCIVG
eukprot:9467463-Pyramimonas_sp.AAC.2